jgi:hypothetical protein
MNLDLTLIEDNSELLDNRDFDRPSVSPKQNHGPSRQQNDTGTNMGLIPGRQATPPLWSWHYPATY